MDMAEQNSGATKYRYAAATVMVAAWSVGILQLFGVRF
jgi:hypothetical protein